jgi:hypothetical protein
VSAAALQSLEETVMIDDLPERQQETGQVHSSLQRKSRGLQIALWSLWTLAVVVAGYLGWRADTLAGRPLNLIGMAVNAVTVGIVGLIVLTLIEMRLEPWRFL